MATMGERIRELRRRRLLTQEELAQRAGVAVVTINRAELDKGTLRSGTIRRLAHALDVDAEWLAFGDVGTAHPPRTGPPREERGA